jgi:transcriptional regulator with XRE-family HTH domain
MDFLQTRQKMMTHDTSPEAIHRRLVAIQKVTGLSGKQIAEAAGIKYTTYKSQEKSGAPSVKLMTFYLQAYQIDYNFILGGDPSRLPSDTLAAILAQID